MIYSLSLFGILCVIAQIINILFKDTGLRMFYISPYNPTPIIVFKSIEAHMGWFANMVIYGMALTIGATLFGLLSIAINKIRYKLTYKIQSKELRKNKNG